jgi:hypothetical protein
MLAELIDAVVGFDTHRNIHEVEIALRPALRSGHEGSGPPVMTNLNHRRRSGYRKHWCVSTPGNQ